MKEKVDPYLRPLYDALYELFGPDKIDKKIESGEIEIALAFMRGEHLNCFAIGQLKMQRKRKSKCF